MLNFKRRFALASTALYLLPSLLSADPALTTIQDVLYKADGSRFNGLVQITWTGFRAADNSNIPTQTVSAQVTNGYLHVVLVPTTNALTHAVYNVVYNSDGVVTFSEVWVVPPSTSPLRVADVRSSQLLGSLPASSLVQISDVSGLRTELSLRATIGPGFAPSRAAIIDSVGGLDSATGNLSDCVHVDGTSGPCGSTMSIGGSPLPNFIDAETPAGIVDGVNVTYQLANSPSPAASVILFRNGLALAKTTDFTFSGSTITFQPASIPQPGDVLQVSYRTGTSSQGASPAVPSCSQYTLSNNGSTWTVGVNGATPAAGPTIASSITQDIPLFALPPKAVIVGIREKTTNRWSGPSFTTLSLSVGDSVGGVGFFTPPSYDLTATPGNTNFRNTQLFKSATDAGSNVMAHLSANQNLNASPITGSVDAEVCSVVLP